VSDPTFGLVLRPTVPLGQQLQLAREAVEDGVEELWLWEDCFLHGGPSSAAAILASTQHLRVGIGLMPVPLRNPALTAMEIATLAGLFPGRFLPALGHGVPGWMAQVGAGVDSPMSLLREHVTAVRDLLHGKTVTTAGRHVSLSGVALEQPPLVVPPLLIGAHGVRTLALAGEIADGVLLDSHVTPRDVRSARATVSAAWADAERAGSPRVVVYVKAGGPVALPDTVKRLLREYGDAGADAVVFVPDLAARR
jgi:alkanesulfonate monooxygenase SsuD/methylene tetrahydromethanopterin reductase-like flavin-dependent oxidoreductase (luciferase family)